MSFQDKRDLWYISGNKKEGEVFAIPVVEVEEGARLLDDEIARLTDSEVDGARRWIVVADDGEGAINKFRAFIESLRGIRVTQAIAEQAARDGFEMWIDPFMGCFIRTDNAPQSIEDLRRRYRLNPNWNEQKLPNSAFKAIPGIHFDSGTITLMEASKYYGIPYPTLAEWAREGKLAARKSAGAWLTTREAIERMIDS